MPRSYSPSSKEVEVFALTQISSQPQATGQPSPPPLGSINYNSQSSASQNNNVSQEQQQQHHHLDISFDSSYEFAGQLESGISDNNNNQNNNNNQSTLRDQQATTTSSQHQQRQQQYQSTRYPTSDDLESETSNDSRNHDLDTKWSWKSLKREFKLSHSESLFHLYQAKLQHSFFVALLILNLIFYSGAIISHSLSQFLVDRC